MGSDKLRAVPVSRMFHAKPVGVLVGGWCALTGLLVLAGIGVVHSSAAATFDRHITATVVGQRTDALDQAMRVVTWLGSWVAPVAAAALLLTLAIRGRLRWTVALLAGVAWAGEEGSITLAKHAVGRHRPPMDIWLQPAHGWSWPSGHTATAALVFSVLAVVVTGLCRSQVVHIGTWAATALTIAAVGFSRIELGVHWTTDVIASLIFVPSWLLVIVVLFATEIRDGIVPRSPVRDVPVAEPTRADR